MDMALRSFTAMSVRTDPFGLGTTTAMEAELISARGAALWHPPRFRVDHGAPNSLQRSRHLLPLALRISGDPNHPRRLRDSRGTPRPTTPGPTVPGIPIPTARRNPCEGEMKDRNPTARSHYHPAEVAKMLGITRQAIHGRIKRQKCPVEIYCDRPWIPSWWVADQLEAKNKVAK